MLQIGDIRIYRINDSDLKVDPGGAFGLVPRVLWSLPSWVWPSKRGFAQPPLRGWATFAAVLSSEG